MSKVKALQIKLERHQAYYDIKKQQLNQLDMTSRKWLNRYSRLLDLSNLITKLIIELNTEMMIAAFTSEEETEMDVQDLQDKILAHQSFFFIKFDEYEEMDIFSSKSANRKRRLDKHFELTMKLIKKLKR